MTREERIDEIVRQSGLESSVVRLMVERAYDVGIEDALSEREQNVNTLALEMVGAVREVGGAGQAGPYVQRAHALGLDYNREWWAVLAADIAVKR